MAMHTVRSGMAACALALNFWGCGGQPLIPVTATPLAYQDHGYGNEPRTAGPKNEYLYAAHCCTLLKYGNVTVYEPLLKGLVRQITQGVLNPVAVAFDSSQTLYVTNLFYGVTEWDRGSRQPSRAIRPIYGAIGSALDASNNLYVINCVRCIPYAHRKNVINHDSIVVFSAKRTRRSYAINDKLFFPHAVVVDGAGYVYVANGESAHYHAYVTVYRPHSTKLWFKIENGNGVPRALALDRSGDLFIANQPSEVREYAPESRRLLRVITQGIDNPTAMLFDESGRLYVANRGYSSSSKGWISVYAPGALSPKYQIVEGVNDPVALALDGHDDLYVANVGGRTDGKIVVYAPNGVEPVRIVKNDLFNSPVSLALGPK
ncbi:MAG: hypothetical protein JO078_06195 [Candidatus Eremiobacteraeota bacterium]|nr:hypothetical protein [Candidatus Eremiobacteraeota bacterium]